MRPKPINGRAAPVDSALATFPLDSPMEAKKMKRSSLPRASPDAARGRAVAGKSVAKPTDQGRIRVQRFEFWIQDSWTAQQKIIVLEEGARK